ncbi:unnamed protein product [Rotaria magnacalcarata]|uniref:HAT C-terminal dimerisation domain-containing protein n=2 Tax=Rotaria magnacalcarata TaxID=392030 RepID=A0A816CKW1_9BILA|nr:unnamed protein product [Rotaria magnacalcarata]CAF1646604.1 unnamed protein product [Rotaria magnacalcarata]CAF3823028.1 unnamed protein product [Rotaria magnacalcarata]CAF3853614.1 unnamed protein product [Rotaria magnacalcarata]
MFFSNIDRDLLQDICEFLIPFDTVLQTLSDNKRPTLHRVLPFKQLLINKCTITNKESTSLQQIKIFLKKRLIDKWQLSDEHLIATLIHPNLKHFHMCPHPREHAIGLLKQEMLSRQEDAPIPRTSAVQNSSEMSSSISSTSHPSSSSSNSISKQNTSTARKDLLMEIFDKKGPLTEKRVVEQELEKYLMSMTVLENEDDNDILSYWREHQQAFPLIASTARHIFDYTRF